MRPESFLFRLLRLQVSVVLTVPPAAGNVYSLPSIFVH